METHYHVEKHREALLWSLLMARFDGNQDGSFDDDERTALWDWLQDQSRTATSTNDQLAIRRPHRDASSSLDKDLLLRKAGFSAPRIGPYAFTSTDGYAYSEPDSWPRYPTMSGSSTTQCTISVTECFGESFFTAQNASIDAQIVFRRISFALPQCGDCLITAGLTASGQLGFEAFLPPSSGQSGQEAKHVAPQLAMDSKDWRDADFSVSSVMQSWPLDLRSFVVRLLQRYQYAISNGENVVQQLMITSSRGLEATLRGLNPSLAYLSLNDDIVSNEDVPEVNRILDEWMDFQWPQRTIWEKQE